MQTIVSAELVPIEHDDDLADTWVRLDGVRVLVVDDDDDARGAIVTVLEECGADVLAAASGGEALALMKRATVHVLVSDIAMPGMDGHRLIRRVRDLAPQRGGNVPAVALTAYAAPPDRTRALLAGYQVYLPKPFDPPELVTLVAKLAGLTTDA
jgi:CheY-like chemotaxis protein